MRRERITPAPIREKGKEFVAADLRHPAKVKTKDIAIFFRQFSVMIDAGLPLVQCLEILAANQENPAFQKTLTGVRTTVEGGATLANAMRQYPEDLRRPDHQHDRGRRNRRYSRHHSAAPGDLRRKGGQVAGGGEVGVDLPGVGGQHRAFLIVGALLKWVVPIFANLFVGLGVDLPLPTRIVMGLSAFVGQFWWFVIVGMVWLVFGIKQIRKDPKGRYYFDSCLLKLPVLGVLLRKIAVARFTRTLGTLITSGVPILEGLSITAQNLGQRGAGRGADESAQGHRRRPHYCRSAEGIAECFPTW